MIRLRKNVTSNTFGFIPPIIPIIKLEIQNKSKFTDNYSFLSNLLTM